MTSLSYEQLASTDSLAALHLHWRWLSSRQVMCITRKCK